MAIRLSRQGEQAAKLTTQCPNHNSSVDVVGTLSVGNNHATTCKLNVAIWLSSQGEQTAKLTTQCPLYHDSVDDVGTFAVGTAAADAPGLVSFANADAVAALGILNVAGNTSNPSFFMSLVTILKDTRMWPWDLTLVTEKRKVAQECLQSMFYGKLQRIICFLTLLHFKATL